MSEEKIKKNTASPFFFLIGHNFFTSEDLIDQKFTECRLMINLRLFLEILTWEQSYGPGIVMLSTSSVFTTINANTITIFEMVLMIIRFIATKIRCNVTDE